MALNRAFADARKMHYNVSGINGSGVGNLCKSGDPGAVGEIAIVCLTDEDADGMASTDNEGAYHLDVNPAADMAQGDIVYWDNAAGELNDDNTGVRFGYVTEPVLLVGAPHNVVVKLGY